MPETVRLVATARQCYRGRWYCSGDTFDATPADAADLIAIRFAALAPPETKSQDTLHLPKDAARYERRDMRPRK